MNNVPFKHSFPTLISILFKVKNSDAKKGNDPTRQLDFPTAGSGLFLTCTHASGVPVPDRGVKWAVVCVMLAE